MTLGYFTRRARQASQPSESAPRSKPTVLVIDDDPNILGALELVLRSKYQVRLCDSGEQGVAEANQDVAAVVLDVKMPGMDGFQVSRLIQARSPDMPIIFYSAYQNILDMDQMQQEHRPFGYFDKDGSIDGLLACIEAAVHQQASAPS